MDNLGTNPEHKSSHTKMVLADELFFRVYQCANMLHKTGTRAAEEEGLTTQQLAVLGTLSREKAQVGMGISDLARFLMVSRQSISGIINRMERDGHLAVTASGQDRRSRVVKMTESGHHVWHNLSQPKIYAYYNEILGDFSVNDVTHALHYLLKILENMQRLDVEWRSEDEDPEPQSLK